MSVDNVNKGANSRVQQYQLSSKEKRELNRNHQNEMTKIKNTQLNETEQLQSEHRQQVLAEKERQAETLNRLRTELDRTQRSLSDQKDFLIDSQHKTIDEKQEKQNEKLSMNEVRFSDKLATQKDRHEDIMHKANQDFNQDKSQILLDQQDSLSALEEKSKANLNKRTQEVNTRAQYENKLNQAQFRNIKIENNHQLQAQDSEWKDKIRVQNTSNQMELQRQEKLWKKSINDEMINHQKLYVTTLEQQKAEFKNQEAIFAKENEKIKTEASTKLNHIMNKTADPFYQNSNLQPDVKDIGDSYQIVIPVADHEKDHYILNAHDRTLTLSFSRDFQQDIKQQDNVSKTRRVESYSKKFFVPEIVKTNTVSKNYEDGKLTFNIKKA